MTQVEINIPCASSYLYAYTFLDAFYVLLCIDNPLYKVLPIYYMFDPFQIIHKLTLKTIKVSFGFTCSDLQYKQLFCQ